VIEGSKKTDQIYGLDLIRFGSAMMVLLFHLFFWIGVPSPASDGGPKISLFWGSEWASSGWVGVEIFFVISGYVIAASANGKSALAFLRSRIRRLLPGVWIAVVFALTIALAAHFIPVKTLLRNALLSSTLNPYGPWLDIVYWTLAVEVSFYALIFLMLLGNVFSRFPQLLIGLAVYSGGAWITAAMAEAFNNDRMANLVLSAMDRHIFKLILLRHGCYFAIGGLIWLCSARRITAPRLISIIIAGAGCFIELHYRTLHQQGAPSSTTLVPLMIWILAVIAMFASVRYSALITSIFKRFDDQIRFLGLVTFPLYLIHHVSGVTIIRALMHAGLPQILSQALTAALMIAVASLIVQWIEPFVLRLLDIPLRKITAAAGANVRVLSRTTTAVQ